MKTPPSLLRFTNICPMHRKAEDCATIRFGAYNIMVIHGHINFKAGKVHISFGSLPNKVS